MVDFDTEGRAYGRPAPSYDAALVEVGPGTPGGELLRRYWHPVALAREATDLPKLIRRFGEDLILFRNRNGEAGLLYPRCAHRGVSLLYGRVEDDGIRCCYHGWKFGPKGHCLEQPAEPGGGVARGRIRQPWYPVVEKFGAIWTYMGPPEKQPAFPAFSHFENLAEDEEIRPMYFSENFEIGPFPVDHNWFQFFENATDHFHVPILHAMISGDQFMQRRMAIMPKVKWTLTEDGGGVLTHSVRHVDKDEDAYVRVAQVTLPNRIALPPFFGVGPSMELSFAIPMDDENHVVIHFERKKKDAPDLDFRELSGFGPEKKLWYEMTFEEHQRAPNDYEAMIGQGRITLHSEETLATSDRGVGMLRQLYRQQCKLVAEGGDPVGVGFDAASARVSVVAESWALAPDGERLETID